MDIIFFGDSITKGNIGVSFFDILKDKLPQHNLVNYGRNGDTMTSLLKRIEKMDMGKKYDIAFIWVGTNDILACVSVLHKASKIICRQAWSKKIEDFNQRYTETIEMVNKHTKKIITVSPLLLDEEEKNSWNKKLVFV